MEQSNDRLVQQALKDADAFAQLYRRHLHRVYSYLLSHVGNVQDAQDLTSQTFMAALENLPSYKPQGMFSAWLLSIARHKAADHFRQNPPLEPLNEDMLMHPAPPLDVFVQQRLQMREVAALLEKLHPDRAEALRLRVFGELKMREIADLMGKSEGAVKMLVARALEDTRHFLNLPEESHS